jgi:ubiquinone/menaquinone biosynthesis C-methylase UbiE
VKSQEQFDRQASHYNSSWNEWSESSLRWLLDHAAPRKTDRLLDVATGTGFTALAFALLVAEVVGVDISGGMLAQAAKQARERGVTNVLWQQAPAEQLPFEAASFDLVTARVAPHHFEDIQAFVNESYRVLRPGGRLLIADTSVPDDHPDVDEWQNQVEQLRDPSHVRNYCPSEWRSFAERAGFEVVAVERCDELKPIHLHEWMQKAGCTGEPASTVQRLFDTAPEAARREFSIEPLAEGDYTFKWMRVVMEARKPASVL